MDMQTRGPELNQEPFHPLLEAVCALHRKIRDGVLDACRAQSLEAVSSVADDGAGDTQYAIDRFSESSLMRELAEPARIHGGVVLIAEGISGAGVALPEGFDQAECRYRMIVDPIDGTRGLMYQKRSAWVLTGVAPNRGAETRLADIELAVQTEIPLLKQHLADQLWAVRAQGARALRVNVETGERRRLHLAPSRAGGIEHGYATISRFFPGAKDELGAIDEELMTALLGPPLSGKARCFEDQYASTGGQLYELLSGHDRFIADLRPLLGPVLRRRGLPLPLCCHPYDICTALIAEQLGVKVRSPWGGRLDVPLDIDFDVAWVGYANDELLRRIEPLLIQILERRQLGMEST
jgi:hypothetical protein